MKAVLLTSLLLLAVTATLPQAAAIECDVTPPDVDVPGCVESAEDSVDATTDFVWRSTCSRGILC